MATVTNQTQLRSALQNGTDPEVLVANNITVTSYIIVNRSVTVRSAPGNPTATIFWVPPATGNNKFLFRVFSSGNLMMDTLTLDCGGRDGGLVHVNGGIFNMNEGTTLTGIRSRATNNAVRVGNMTSAVGGVFNMNGGLITGVDVGPDTIVMCFGGTVTMSGNAAIKDNPTTAITTMHNLADNTRSTLKITGNARIENNLGGQSGAGMMLLYTDAVIGEDENDAPVIAGNYTPFNAGGIIAIEAVDLTIGGKTEISGNSALLTSGAILVQGGSKLHMSGSVKVIDNKSGGISGGITVTSNSTAVFEGDVEISGNAAGDKSVTGGAGIGDAGGVLLQTGATLEIKGNVFIHENTANNGGGIYLATPLSGSAYGPPSAVIGAEDSSPSVYLNKAENFGGGIFIADKCTATLTGRSRVYDNEAVEGKGVYNGGILKVGKSTKILDGLFFDNAGVDGYSGFSFEPAALKIRLESSEPDEDTIEYEINLETTADVVVSKKGKRFPASFSAGAHPVQCSRAPIIDEHLTAEAEIHVETSEHVTPPNVSLVIANGDSDTMPLLENDRAAWRIPLEFTPGYVVVLTSPLDQVIIDVERYAIEYKDLFSSANPNPAAYDLNGLPISFAAPGERKGYRFTGWRGESGGMVSEIPRGTTGNLSFTAVWQVQDYNIVYNNLFGTGHSNPVSYNAETLPILLAAPEERPGYAFLGWRDASGVFVTGIPEGATGDLSFTAVWSELSLSFDGNAQCVSNVPESIRAENGVVDIPSTIPCRPCYIFVCWNEPESGSGKVYFPGDKIYVSERNVKLYAQWLYVGCC